MEVGFYCVVCSVIEFLRIEEMYIAFTLLLCFYHHSEGRCFWGCFCLVLYFSLTFFTKENILAKVCHDLMQTFGQNYAEISRVGKLVVGFQQVPLVQLFSIIFIILA